MNQKKEKQAFLKIGLGTKKLWIGIAFAVLSLGLCQIAGASKTAKLILSVMFLAVSVVELECAPLVEKVLTVLWSIGATFAILFTSQLLLNESTFSLGVQRILLNMALCGIVIGLLYLITGRLRLSVILGMAILLTFTAANYFVFLFRGSELCPADFLSVGTALSVVDRYTFRINGPFAYAVILTLVYAFAIYTIKKCDDTRTVKHRIYASIGLVALILSVFLGSDGIAANHFLQSGSVNNGYILNFFLEIEESMIAEPDSYNKTMITSIESTYCENAKENEPGASPDVIVIMNESFADLSVLGDEVYTNIDILPYYNSLTENVIRGYALSSVIGGGTANSEYEFLSGNTMGFLPAGSIVYQQFIYDNPYTLVPYLNDLGYTTVATHPAEAKNWLRYSVYPKMGFDEMFFIEDYPQKDILRGFVSDREMYERIIHRYEECGPEEKLFLFGITMQNHGFYSYEGDDFENTVYLENYVGSYPDVEQYLSVLHESDIAFEYLIRYFENVDRDVVILFYGDHYPKLPESFFEEVHGGSFDTLDEQMLQYTVPFFIWANFDIEEQYIEQTSINFLSTLLLETAGVELPAYNQFLKDVNEVIPAMNSFGYYSKAQGRFVAYEDATGEEAQWIQKYRFLQYNCIFDQEASSEVFFPALSAG